ncbi:UNVERIFIED_CONTAM: hypothetical protein GTU68_026104 [Idotea baltica]|nr:hypothetical protein [Idotea baltica]
MVLRGFATACLLACSPTIRSPSLVNATTEGVVRFPSALTITCGSFPSMTATQEFVVPKSMPIILLMSKCSFILFSFYSMSIFEVSSSGSGIRGNRMVNTPASYFALIFSNSALRGSANDRKNVP